MDRSPDVLDESGATLVISGSVAVVSLHVLLLHRPRSAARSVARPPPAVVLSLQRLPQLHFLLGDAAQASTPLLSLLQMRAIERPFRPLPRRSLSSSMAILLTTVFIAELSPSTDKGKKQGARIRGKAVKRIHSSS